MKHPLPYKDLVPYYVQRATRRTTAILLPTYGIVFVAGYTLTDGMGFDARFIIISILMFILCIMTMYAVHSICIFDALGCDRVAFLKSRSHNYIICEKCLYPIDKLPDEQGVCPECGIEYNKKSLRFKWKFIWLRRSVGLKKTRELYFTAYCNPFNEIDDPDKDIFEV